MGAGRGTSLGMWMSLVPLHQKEFPGTQHYSRTILRDSPSPRIGEPRVISWIGSERNKEMKQAELSLVGCLLVGMGVGVGWDCPKTGRIFPALISPNRQEPQIGPG